MCVRDTEAVIVRHQLLVQLLLEERRDTKPGGREIRSAQNGKGKNPSQILGVCKKKKEGDAEVGEVGDNKVHQVEGQRGSKLSFGREGGEKSSVCGGNGYLRLTSPIFLWPHLWI